MLRLASGAAVALATVVLFCAGLLAVLFVGPLWPVVAAVVAVPFVVGARIANAAVVICLAAFALGVALGVAPYLAAA